MLVAWFNADHNPMRGVSAFVRAKDTFDPIENRRESVCSIFVRLAFVVNVNVFAFVFDVMLYNPAVECAFNLNHAIPTVQP